MAGCGTTNNSAGGGGGNTATGNQAATQPTGANKNITIGMINWSEDVAATYLWRDIMKSKGYNVTLKKFSDPGQCTRVWRATV